MTPPAATGPAFRGPGPVIWITCSGDGQEHAVFDDDRGGSARLATCGHTVIPAALITPPGRRCTYCAMRQRRQPSAPRTWVVRTFRLRRPPKTTE